MSIGVLLALCLVAWPAAAADELTISELAVQAVRPRVVWALDDARADRGEVAGEQLVAAVPGRVEEPAQDAVLTAHQHDALRPNANGTLIRGVGQIGRAPRAHPRPVEERALLPFQHVGGRVGPRRQRHASVERVGHRPQERSQL